MKIKRVTYYRLEYIHNNLLNKFMKIKRVTYYTLEYRHNNLLNKSLLQKGPGRKF